MRMTCARESASGLISTGFMSAVGAMPQAAACNACARPISLPSAQTAALLDIFCALNGATLMPRRAKIRHNAVTSRLLPAEELLPWIIKTLTVIFVPGFDSRQRWRGANANSLHACALRCGHKLAIQRMHSHAQECDASTTLHETAHR